MLWNVCNGADYNSYNVADAWSHLKSWLVNESVPRPKAEGLVLYVAAHKMLFDCYLRLCWIYYHR